MVAATSKPHMGAVHDQNSCETSNAPELHDSSLRAAAVLSARCQQIRDLTTSTGVRLGLKRRLLWSRSDTRAHLDEGVVDGLPEVDTHMDVIEGAAHRLPRSHLACNLECPAAMFNPCEASRHRVS